MSNEQWTPGPWVWDLDECWLCAPDPHDPEDGLIIVECSQIAGPPSEPERSLIAAAPRLYEALKTLLDSYGYTSYLSEEERLSDPDVEEAIGALMEARGETQ